MKKLFKLLSKKVDEAAEHERLLILDRLSKVSGQIEKEKVMKKLWFDERGMSTIEYAMMVAVIACVAVLGFELLGLSTKSLLDVANTLLPFGK